VNERHIGSGDVVWFSLFCHSRLILWLQGMSNIAWNNRLSGKHMLCNPPKMINLFRFIAIQVQKWGETGYRIYANIL
jgi:hypothetical protein